MLKEWPLVAFTILGQTSVGLSLVSAWSLFFKSDGGPSTLVGRERALPGLVLALALLLAAVLVSFFHLGHPLRARRALANLRTSWLSREILFELGFLGAVALAVWRLWRSSGPDGVGRSALAAAAVLGLLFLFSMARIYMLDTIPSWDQAFTPLSFLLSSLSLGPLSTALVAGGAAPPASISPLVLATLAAGACSVAATLFVSPYAGALKRRPRPSLRPPGRAGGALIAVRVGASAAGLIVLTVLLAVGEGSPAGAWARTASLSAALALILAGEAAGRFLFYGMIGRPGV